MKKIERSRQFLSEKKSLFRCPVCTANFEGLEGNSLICSNRHQFDLTKKGTIHFLQKSGKNEYDTAMLTSRLRLSQTGFFHPILDRVVSRLKEREQLTILDVGCGEGSHLHYVASHASIETAVGFDISKDAIQLAATNYFDDAFWCVADLAHSPFANQSFDCILNIFSPSHYEEFERILAPGGMVIKIVPEAAYLMELRERLYANEAKQSYDNADVVNRFKEEFPNATEETISYQVSLTPESYQWLQEMTPLTWNASVEQLNQAPLEKITVSVRMMVGFKI